MGTATGGRNVDQTRADLARVAVERSLRDREISFSAVARIAPVGILRFDSEGRCNYVNDRWCQMTGLTIDEAIGEGWKEAIHPEDRGGVVTRWAAMRHQNETFHEEYRLCAKNGAIRWVTAEGAALHEYSGEPLGFIRTVTDITHHRQLEEQLMAARQELEQRVRERTAELETEIAERERLEKQVLEAKDEEQRRFSRDLHDGLGQHLIGIEFRVSALQQDLERAGSALAADAAELIALVKDASGQAHKLVRGVHPVPLRPDGLMLALQDLVNRLSRTTKTRCSFECDEPVHLENNPLATHLYRIAQEALTNAVKHSDAKTIHVELCNLGNTAELIVRDDGRGFDHGETTAAGSGLNIMRHRARLINGSLNVESSRGGGTLVRCTFGRSISL